MKWSLLNNTPFTEISYYCLEDELKNGWIEAIAPPYPCPRQTR